MKVIIFLSLSRQGYPNGAPKLLTECDQGLELAQLFPLGLEVLINARRVRSDLIDLQATVVWPKFTEVPLYKLKPSKLDADEAKFHSLCSRLKKMTPICINGLPGTGSLNIWSAKVQEILDEDWGLVEVSSYPRDAMKGKIFCKATNVLSQIKENYDLTELTRRKPDMICYNLPTLSKMVSHCRPTGRLVCMLGETSGVLEDHRRQLAYFEMADTNLPSDLTMKDHQVPGFLCVGRSC